MQKLSTDYLQCSLETATAGVLGLIAGPAGHKELITVLGAGVSLIATRRQIQATRTEANAKALVIKVLMDRGFVKIDEDRHYLALD